MKNIYFHIVDISINNENYIAVRIFTINNDNENLYIQDVLGTEKPIKIPFNKLSYKEVDIINKNNHLYNL